MTVSNAYSRPDQLSAALRERIFEAAERLGYPGPDPLGRGLSRGRTGTIGVLYRDRPSYAFDDPAAVSFLRGISAAAERESLGLLLVPRSPRESARRTAGGAMVDGFVAYSVDAEDRMLRSALDRHVPVVIVDGPWMEGVPFVGAEEELATAEAVRHLLDLGHEKFGLLSPRFEPGPVVESLETALSNTETSGPHPRRVRGYATALRKAGISLEAVPHYKVPPDGASFAPDAATILFPTALLATSDRLALGAVRTAGELGLSVPKDLSVVGFDDTWLATSATPPLTTIYQDHETKGLLAGQTLISEIEERDQEPIKLLPTRLVTRDSVAPPAEKLTAEA